MNERRRIDVHQHVLPPRYTNWLRALGVLDGYDALDAEGHAAIDRRNALALFPEEP